MHDAFVYAAIKVFGPQAVVIDRYHVAKLYWKNTNLTSSITLKSEK